MGMNRLLVVALTGCSLSLGGCVASTAMKIATAPVRVASKAVDLATTSQAEADRNYGRKARKAEEREGRERRAQDKACRRDSSLCRGYDGYRAGESRND
jgi:hypothetical protein